MAVKIVHLTIESDDNLLPMVCTPVKWDIIDWDNHEDRKHEVDLLTKIQSLDDPFFKRYVYTKKESEGKWFFDRADPVFEQCLKTICTYYRFGQYTVRKACYTSVSLSKICNFAV